MLSTVPSTVLLTLLLLNSRVLTLITNACRNATHILVSQIPNNTNSNIKLLFLSILDTTAPVGNNTIRLSLCQNFIITFCESNSVTESSEVCNIASEYDMIEVEDLIDLDEKSQALEAGKSLIYVATAPSMC
jgi:hypothetical protein